MVRQASYRANSAIHDHRFKPTGRHLARRRNRERWRYLGLSARQLAIKASLEPVVLLPNLDKLVRCLRGLYVGLQLFSGCADSLQKTIDRGPQRTGLCRKRI